MKKTLTYLTILLIAFLSLAAAVVQETVNTCQVVYNGKYEPNGSTWVILDHEEHGKREVALAEANDSIPIAYMSAHWEQWRKDSAWFESCTMGPIPDWDNEQYVDWDKYIQVARKGKLVSIQPVKLVMQQRLDEIKANGFLGVDIDNVDGPDSLAYFAWLFDEAKARGLLVGLKNCADVYMENGKIKISKNCNLYTHGSRVDFFVTEASDRNELHVYEQFSQPCFRMYYKKGAETPMFMSEATRNKDGNRF